MDQNKMTPEEKAKHLEAVKKLMDAKKEKAVNGTIVKK